MNDPLQWVAPELRPGLQLFLAGPAFQPPGSVEELQQLRANGRQVPPPSPDIPLKARRIQGPKGAPQLTVWLVNAGAPGARPGILHMHGGGYVLGSAENNLSLLQPLARELDCVIVSVEYRLAPETQASGSVEDNYAALKWLHANAAELGVDPGRIAVMGESAGGGHAALLAQTARARGEVPVLLQVLMSPMLDDRTGSSRPVPDHIGQLVWTREWNRYGWGALLGVEPGGTAVPAAAVPARTENLAGLPPAFIAIGGIDLFVEEAMDYARRLTAAGVATALLVIPGAYHGFDFIAADTGLARSYNGARTAALRRAFENGVGADPSTP